MRRTTSLIAAAGISAGLSLTACGDDTAAALSKPDFVAQADAICATTDAELEPVWDALWAMDDVDLAHPDELDEADRDLVFTRLADAMDTVGAAWPESIDDIRVLGVPTADAEIGGSLLADREAAVDEFTSNTRAAADGDAGARGLIDDSDDDPMAEVNQRAREYGLTVCGAAG